MDPLVDLFAPECLLPLLFHYSQKFFQGQGFYITFFHRSIRLVLSSKYRQEKSIAVVVRGKQLDISFF